MDKSFNDQELSDIMKEIEALEVEFKADDEITPSPILEQLAALDEEKSVPQAKVIPFEAKTKTTPATTGTGTSMSFKVQGDLNLDLKFEIGGKVVALAVSEKGLTIEMDGGMTFSIPLTDKTSHKKSA